MLLEFRISPLVSATCLAIVMSSVILRHSWHDGQSLVVFTSVRIDAPLRSPKQNDVFLLTSNYDLLSVMTCYFCLTPYVWRGHLKRPKYVSNMFLYVNLNIALRFIWHEIRIGCITTYALQTCTHVKTSVICVTNLSKNLKKVSKLTSMTNFPKTALRQK